MKKNIKFFAKYKGFGIYFIQNIYRAESYGNQQFTETNLKRLKTLIINYLKN